MAKSAPTISNITAGQSEATVRGTHLGHRITKVGVFSDNNESNRGDMTYHVFYCQTDHTLFVV